MGDWGRAILTASAIDSEYRDGAVGSESHVTDAVVRLSPLPSRAIDWMNLWQMMSRIHDGTGKNNSQPKLHKQVIIVGGEDDRVPLIGAILPLHAIVSEAEIK